jgi:hypothetical protein
MKRQNVVPLLTPSHHREMTGGAKKKVEAWPTEALRADVHVGGTDRRGNVLLPITGAEAGGEVGSTAPEHHS